MSLRNRIGIYVVCLLLSAGATAATAEVVVVVSAKSTVKVLNNNQAADIFLGKTSRLPTGEAVVPVDQTDGSDIWDEFYMKLIGKSPAQIKSYWSKIIFTGKGQPPRELMDSKAVKKAVTAIPNRIGYIKRSEVDASVRVVMVIE
ncbi:MAG: phosphate ABC transporter substrate-binding protein [Burkholderiaceae bacterium]|nr:phosphate ABC transporter substrate-binding protein [Burkholderiaceae bacterium]